MQNKPEVVKRNIILTNENTLITALVLTNSFIKIIKVKTSSNGAYKIL